MVNTVFPIMFYDALSVFISEQKYKLFLNQQDSFLKKSLQFTVYRLRGEVTCPITGKVFQITTP